MKRIRLDAELVRRHLVESRSAGQALIEQRKVTVNGSPANKAARMVLPGDAIEIAGPPKQFVSRGGEKLNAALDSFDVDVNDRRILDAGASTGGFTDVLLQRGAREVVAIDVGYGQLHEKLRSDPRVTNMERTNIRSIDTATIGGPVDVVVGDLSFISLSKVSEVLLSVCATHGDLVLLVKPQFEAGKKIVSAGRGVVKSPEVWESTRNNVIASFVANGAVFLEFVKSPITGADGNVEFLIHLKATKPSGL